MRKSRVRGLTGWILLVLLLATVSAPASAAAEWTRVGSKVWLTAGQGINLATGEAGDDLVFNGDTVSAPHGMQVVNGSGRYVDLTLTPPAKGYVTSLDTGKVSYSRLVVRLADGGLAQVAVGMASISGLVYSGLFLEEWAVIPGSGNPADDPEPVNRGEARLTLNSHEAQANGAPATLDVPPQFIDGHLMVPLRFVGESLGLTLRWDGREQKVTITGDGLDMTLWVGRKTALINGKTVGLNHPATLVEDRLMVPLLIAGEALGPKATYDQATGEIIMGGSGAPAKPAPPGADDTTEGTVHFSAVWLNAYEGGLISDSASAKPDFYLTLNPDGSARVIQTITGLIGGSTYVVNLEYKGTYTLNPLKVELRLQPAIRGWETLEHRMDGWQTMTVTGELTDDLSRIENLEINDRAAKSGSAARTQGERVPEPGQAK